MNRTPWRLWNFWKGIPNPKGSAVEAMAVLEGTFEKFPSAWEHAGLLHMYIHLMEMSPHPEKALRHGDILTNLMPDAGHLVHMATHIDVLCGDYQNVLSRNLLASKVDNAFKLYAGADNFYALYRIHNLHFAMYGAMFLGQKAAALSAVSRLQEEVPEAVVKLYPDIFETFVAAAVAKCVAIAATYPHEVVFFIANTKYSLSLIHISEPTRILSMWFSGLWV